MGPILAAVVVTEIDTIERFPSAQKLCGYAGLCPSTSSSGAKTFQGKLLPRCNKWLRSRFCGGRLGGGGMLALFWGLLSPQALRGQEGQQRYPGHRPADGPHHLATLDAESRLRELPHRPRTPMPASLRELLPGRPGKGKAAFSQSQEADFFTTDFPQPLRCTTGWSLSSKLRRRTLGQDGGLGICLSQWQGGLHSPPQREV
jgi:Transposase IS116/IS110/IS902 family